jgi:hemoglobin
MTTLLEQIGGRAAVEQVVADFYGRVLGDAKLAPFFRGVSMSRLQAHQTDFFCAALGEGDVYRGRDMTTAHAGMGVSDEAFDLVVVHLGTSLTEAGVPAAIIDQIVALLAPLRGQIVQGGGSQASAG